MYKLYKREPDRIRYHEAWDEDACVIEHFGVVGQAGETRQHDLAPGADPDQLLEDLLKPSAMDGFEEVDDADLERVEVALPVVADGDLERRHALEDRLDDLLGATGLGHCNGGRIDEQGMAAFCFVVDPTIARSVIKEDLRDSEFADFKII
jgi:hypothetical protein